MHGFDDSISMTLAPLSVIYLKDSTHKKALPKRQEGVSIFKTKKSLLSN